MCVAVQVWGGGGARPWLALVPGAWRSAVFVARHRVRGGGRVQRLLLPGGGRSHGGDHHRGGMRGGQPPGEESATTSGQAPLPIPDHPQQGPF